MKIETIKPRTKVKKTKVIVPIKTYNIYAGYEKNELAGIPVGHVRVIVLIDYKGMEEDLYCGDIIDLPDRRFKTLRSRGLVKEYIGTKLANKLR